MTIEKGKTYTDRDGGKVEILQYDHARELYPFLARYSDGYQCWLDKKGNFYNGSQPSKRDIVGGWIEPATDESGQSPGFETLSGRADEHIKLIGHFERLSLSNPSNGITGSIMEKSGYWGDSSPLGYSALAGILQEAHDQAASGKGKERHANGKPFTEQPIMAIGRMCGLGFQTGQIQKKVQEATGMAARGEADAAIHELLGAINYAAAAVLLIREQKSAAQ